MCSIASQGRFRVSENGPFFVVDITFRLNVAKPQCLPTKYSLSELIPVIPFIYFIRGIRGIYGNGPVRTWGLHAPAAKMTAVHTNPLKLHV